MAVSHLRNTPITGKSYTTPVDATRGGQGGEILRGLVRHREGRAEPVPGQVDGQRTVPAQGQLPLHGRPGERVAASAVDEDESRNSHVAVCHITSFVTRGGVIKFPTGNRTPENHIARRARNDRTTKTCSLSSMRLCQRRSST